VVSEEQDVHADHDGYQREHVKHDGHGSHRCWALRDTDESLRCATDDGVEQERHGLRRKIRAFPRLASANTSRQCATNGTNS
jgi:hypothetical protein